VWAWEGNYLQKKWCKMSISTYREQKQVKAILDVMFMAQFEDKFHSFGPSYMQYRAAVCNWMVDVCRYFKLDACTMHTAISYLDRIQPDERNDRKAWQMFAITCVMLAAKYSECEEHVPELQSLEEITQQEISTQFILEYELEVLKLLSWELNAYTPLAFVTTFKCLGILFKGDVCVDPSMAKPDGQPHDNVQGALSVTLEVLATETLLDLRFKRYRAHEVAAALVYMGRRHHGVQPWWRGELEELTRCSLERVKMMVIMLDKAKVGCDLARDFMFDARPTIAVGSTAEVASCGTQVHGPSDPGTPGSKVYREVVGAARRSAAGGSADVDMTHDSLDEEAVSFEVENKETIAPRPSPSSVVDLDVVVAGGDACKGPFVHGTTVHHPHAMGSVHR